MEQLQDESAQPEESEGESDWKIQRTAKSEQLVTAESAVQCRLLKRAVTTHKSPNKR